MGGAPSKDLLVPSLRLTPASRGAAAAGAGARSQGPAPESEPQPELEPELGAAAGARSRSLSRALAHRARSLALPAPVPGLSRSTVHCRGTYRGPAGLWLWQSDGVLRVWGRLELPRCPVQTLSRCRRPGLRRRKGQRLLGKRRGCAAAPLDAEAAAALPLISQSMYPVHLRANVT